VSKADTSISVGTTGTRVDSGAEGLQGAASARVAFARAKERLTSKPKNLQDEELEVAPIEDIILIDDIKNFKPAEIKKYYNKVQELLDNNKKNKKLQKLFKALDKRMDEIVANEGIQTGSQITGKDYLTVRGSTHKPGEYNRKITLPPRIRSGV